MQLLAPAFEVISRGAPRAGFDHTRYDLAQLVLRTIDFVVTNQASLEGSVTPTRAIDHLSGLARRMAPDDPERPWAKVASLLLNTLLNDGRPHEAVWRELADDDATWIEPRTWRFRLLRLVDGDEGPAVMATDEAIVLYLDALNADLADRAMALKLLVEIQMEAGEFDKALTTARQATRTARGLSASLREKLDDTRRDVRSVDWRGEMPTWLTDVMGQVDQQMERDRQLKDLAERAGEDPEAAVSCRAIVDEVRRSEDVWLRLERRLQQARPVFLDAQEAQRFHPRGMALVIDMTNDLLLPALDAPDERFGAAVDELARGSLPPLVPAQWGITELAKQLLREPVVREVGAPFVDLPGELLDPEGGSIPDDVASGAALVLRDARSAPVRLSVLLENARALAADPAEATHMADVVWGAALWTYVVGSDATGDERPPRAELADAVSGLIGVDDGTELADDRYRGADLLVGTAPAFDANDAAADVAAQAARATPENQLVENR